jgi:hypothetical protein
MARTRVFKSKWFQRFGRKEGIDDATLLETVERVEQGRIDADLGGGVIKQRVGRLGQGRSKGYRAIILFEPGHRAVFLYGFAKSARDNVREDEIVQFREAAKHVLRVSERVVAEMTRLGHLVEVKRI